MSGPLDEVIEDASNNSGGPDAGKPLTILQTISADHFNAAARSVREVAGAVASAGGRAVIAASGAAAGRVRAAGSDLTLLDFSARRRATSALTELATEIGADIIHAHDPVSAEAAHAAAKATGAKMITTFHTPPTSSWRTALSRPAMYQADRAIAVSDALAGEIIGRHGLTLDRITTIPPGADMDIYAEEVVSAHRTIALADALGLDEDPRPVVLTMGRITKQSGHRTLVQAVAGGVGADALFLLVGDEADGAGTALEAEIIAAGLGGVFRRAERVEDTPAALKLASLVCEVSPSYGGQILIEAQAMGRPVIAPAQGAAPGVLDDQSSGWLFPVGDANALNHVLTDALAMDESARAHIGMAGRARVRSRFTLAANLAATLEIYETALGATFRPVKTL